PSAAVAWAARGDPVVTRWPLRAAHWTSTRPPGTGATPWTSREPGPTPTSASPASSSEADRRDRSGHHRHHGPRPRRAGAGPRTWLPRIHPVLPASGLGGARPAGDLVGHLRRGGAGARRCQG